MIKYNDFELKKKTTFKIGGIAHNYYIPESVEEMQNLTVLLKKKNYLLISGGSNLLVNDERVFDCVISCEKFSMKMESINDGMFYIGASNRIQKVISFVNELGYGGFEELIGLPAMFGGIVYMNAGIGSREKPRFNISDFIIRVHCIERNTGEIVWLDNSECNFLYRESIFKRNEYIIIGAEIKLSHQDSAASKARIKKRRKYIKSHQDWGHGCFGSCFSKCSPRLMEISYYISKILFRGDVYQMHSNPNWFVNNGSATYKEVMKRIKLTRFIHKLFCKSIEIEVIIWD